MTAEIITATEEHIPWLTQHIREADRRELWAVSYLSPIDALTLSLQASAKAWTGLVDGEIVCMFGVTPSCVLSGTGRPWMVGTDLVHRHAAVFLRRCKGMVAEMLDLFPHLENYVDIRNTAAIKWLGWLGFKFEGPFEYGIQRINFMRFEMRKEA